MLLIVGLGNSGAAYETTRHNVGFMLIDRLSGLHGIECARDGYRSCWGEGRIAGRDVMLVKPRTMMNSSGDAVLWYMRELELPVESLLVVYDDSDLPLGRIRIRRAGGSGGHRGIASIIEALGVNAFPRIRLGIGRPETGELADHVLSPFSEDETPVLDDMLSRAASSVEAIITGGVESAMNSFNAGE